MPEKVRPLHRIGWGLASALAVSLCGAACGQNGSGDTGAQSDRFAEDIVPVLDRQCNNCHGLDEATYHQFQKEPTNRDLLRWIVDGGGRISTAEQRALAYERCAQSIDYRYPAIVSSLANAPLSATYAGAGHAHVELFATPDDRDYRTLAEWIDREIAAAPKPAPRLELEAEQVFAQQIVPLMERKGCMVRNCHGPLSFSDLKLVSGIPGLPDRFTTAMHARNRKAMLGALPPQIRLVNLAGDVEQSRQVLKNIPIAQGGILHKGGNEFLQKGDADYQTLVRWLELEATLERSRLGTDSFEPNGIVFVRRPRATPERYFEDGAFLGGADLYWKRADGEINLTAELHDGPADIRTPTVDYAAERVAFTMRRSPAEPFNIWEIELASRRARQLTFSDDPAVHFMDPLYAPDPDDPNVEDLRRVLLVMASNKSGEWAATSPDGILGEAEGGTRTAIIDEARTERSGTYDRRRIRIVRGTNLGEHRIVRRQTRGRIVVDRPFSRPVDSTTHYVIDAQARMAPSFDLYRMRLGKPGGERGMFDDTLVRMTYALGQVRRPTMRTTGEVMATSLRTGWQNDRPYYNGAIFRTHDNGAEFHTHGGNRSVIPIYADNQEMRNGLEVRIARDADSYWGGAIIVVDHQFGPPLDPANPLDDLDHPLRADPVPHTQHVYFRAWMSLDPSAGMRGISPGGAYRDPYPLPDGTLLVAHAPGPIDLSDPDAAPNFDIVRLIPDPSYQAADGLGDGRVRREVIVSGPEAELWPRPVVVRPKEPFHKAHKWAEALFGKHRTVRTFHGYSPRTKALLQVYDLPLLDLFFEQSAPAGVRHIDDEMCAVHGEAIPEWKQIRVARIVGAEPQRKGDVGPPRRFVIAEVPLAKDGSFQLLIPAGTPYDVQSLNADRMALAMPSRWLYTHPGEKHTLSIPRELYVQTCEGCHGTLAGHRSQAFGRPDIVSSASRSLAIWDAETHSSKPPANTPGADVPGVVEGLAVGFDEDVRPLLESRCVRCHGASGGLDLHGDKAYESLSAFVDPGGISTHSYLMELLVGRELSAPRSLRADRAQPHVSADLLTPEELLLITRWIDLGAPSRRAALP